MESLPRQSGRLPRLPLRSNKNQSHLPIRHRQLAGKENLRQTGVL